MEDQKRVDEAGEESLMSAGMNAAFAAEDERSSKILVMRHGQTEFNLDHRFLGCVDAPLTKLGEEQSRAAVAGLVAWKPDRIITSPLLRARVAIAVPAARELGVECIVDDRIKEFDFGPLEGMAVDEAIAAGLPFPWGETASSWPPAGGGETMPHFLARAAEAAHEYERLKGRTAVIAHGGMMRALFSAWLGLDVEKFNHFIVDNVRSYIFRAQPGFVALEHASVEPDLLERYVAE